MKNRILILLTEKFPYHNRETFLEDEILYLSNRFKKVFVVPVSVNKRDLDNRREIPTNVTVYPFEFISSFAMKIRILLNLVSPIFERNFKDAS